MQLPEPNLLAGRIPAIDGNDAENAAWPGTMEIPGKRPDQTSAIDPWPYTAGNSIGQPAGFVANEEHAAFFPISIDPTDPPRFVSELGPLCYGTAPSDPRADLDPPSILGAIVRSVPTAGLRLCPPSADNPVDVRPSNATTSWHPDPGTDLSCPRTLMGLARSSTDSRQTGRRVAYFYDECVLS